jgi:hypothetical protein
MKQTPNFSVEQMSAGGASCGFGHLVPAAIAHLRVRRADLLGPAVPFER